ncbi:MAG: hypothetical protein K0U76_01935 [Actinomycetia bacterium]|nr:hypothetical protein [Actinomycetes bacterium]MCH9700139.1 hypothetical protein [Actinomycetes bacterium]MCH9759726.1 hypothetical protein [Actinomycetes bacterium]
MLIDWSDEFDTSLTRLEESTDSVDRQRLRLLQAELSILQSLDEAPTDDTPSLKRVSQSRRYQVWRVAHPYREGVAVRLIVWFPTTDHAVVALLAGDKARMGDVFYDSVGIRADAAIESWIRQTREKEEET